MKTNPNVISLVSIAKDFEVVALSSREEWLAERRNYIGASDAAAVLGRSPWMNEVELWEEKALGKVRKFDGNTSTRRGQLSESHIRELYAIETGTDVLDGTNILCRSLAYPWMSCTLDGIVFKDGHPIALEIKSVRYSDSWTKDTIPEHYFIQVLHQLAVTGWDEAIVLVRFIRDEAYEGASERVYHISRADVKDQINKLVKKEEVFWKQNVMQKKRPSVRMPTV